MEDKGMLVMPKEKKEFSFFRMLVVALVVLIPAVGFFIYLLVVRSITARADVNGLIKASVSSSSPSLSNGKTLDEIQSDIDNTQTLLNSLKTEM